MCIYIHIYIYIYIYMGRTQTCLRKWSTLAIIFFVPFQERSRGILPLDRSTITPAVTWFRV